MAKKFWRLIATIPDTVAHDVMILIAGKGVVESFVPAITGPDSEEGAPTSGVTHAEFIAHYLAEHPRFKNKALVAAAVAAGFNKAAITSAIYNLKSKGVLTHIGPGEFTAKGYKATKAAKPPKTNGAKPGKRAPKGVAEAAVMTRINRANGAPVKIEALAEALGEGGGSPRSISGVIARLIKAKRLKRADEKGHYIAA